MPFELFGRALACRHMAAQRLENLDSDGLFDPANIGLGLAGPDDPLAHRGLRLAAHLLPVVHGEVELGEQLLMRDGALCSLHSSASAMDSNTLIAYALISV